MVFGNGVAAELIATGQEGSLKSTQVLVSNPLYIILGMVLGLGLSGLFFWWAERRKRRGKVTFNEVRFKLMQMQREHTKQKIDNITRFIAALDKEALAIILELTQKIIDLERWDGINRRKEKID
mgnify:CR=1 FL=1